MQGPGKNRDHQINVIANNMQKYVSFIIPKQCQRADLTLQFIDSFQFTSASLEKLLTNI